MRKLAAVLVIGLVACATGATESEEPPSSASGPGGQSPGGSAPVTTAATGGAPGGAAGMGGLGGAAGGDGGAGGFGADGGAGGEGGSGTGGSMPIEQVVSLGPVLNLAIPDDGYNGSLSNISMACVDLVVPVAAANVVAGVTVDVGLDHTWVGDVTIKLQSPMLTIVTLLSRPGVMEANDNGAGVTGDSTNLQGATALRFQDGAAHDAETMGATIGTTEIVCLDDAECEFDPNPGAATAGDLATFNGQPASGTWRLCVGDSGFLDPGTLQNVTLTLQQE